MTQAANLGALGTNAGTTGIVATTGGGTGGTNGAIGFKNRIINGNMVIAQRSVGPVTNQIAPSTLVYDCIDRWGYWAQTSGVFSTQQSSTAPAGFSSSALITSLAATSIVAGSYYTYSQRIEGYNFADLNYGTANAKTSTVSFWIRSSLTGTFACYLFNNGYSRSFTSTFTISAANTWQQVSFVVAGDTTGTWLGTNNNCIEFGICLGAGSSWQNGTLNAWTATSFGVSAAGTTNLVATNAATMYITGVQLEVGSAATNYDFRSYGTELANCQRYCLLVASGSGANLGTGMTYNSSNAFVSFSMPVTMRTAPTLQATTGTNYYTFYYNATAANFNTLTISGSSTNQSVEFYYGGGVSGGGYGVLGRTNDTASQVLLLAEL